MNLKSILVVIVAVLAGTLGGAVAYQVATPDKPRTTTPQAVVLDQADQPTQTSTRAERVVKLRPCRAPSHREGGRCVTDVTRTVVVPAPAASLRSTSPAPAPAPAPSSPSTGDDDQVRHDEGDDHGDDDQTDDDGDDTGTDDDGTDDGDDHEDDGDDDHEDEPEDD